MPRRSNRPQWTWRTLILLIVVFLLAWLLREFAGIDLLGGGEVTDTVAGDWIAVYFTTPRYPDDPALHTGSIDLRLVDLIDAAQKRVDVAAYELDIPTVTDALLRAHRRGVQVRLVTDGEYEDEEMVARLRQAGVPVTVRPKDGGIMHNKFVVVDDTWVWTGSWNLTKNCTYRNNNNAVLIASPRLAENYATEFEELFSGQFGPRSPKNTPYPTVMIEVPEQSLQVPIEVYFAPEDKVASHLIPVLSAARQSIRFMAFSFTSQDIGDTLIQLARRGISVEGVVESRGSDAPYAQYPRLREAGIPVWKDGNPYLLHHKVFIVDGQSVILGSYNFSSSAEKDNDENLLIIHNPGVAQAFLDEYNRVWQQAER
ncbi:MAG: phospholipase D-like domain-containing protein [Anaerolineae bacterium]|nr:phospholipase D-like domain-containing protein [Anaerolineae bacterium]MDW8069022.1 phospholipase D-like domain-containing protein [Anaerolineae bacterium]